MKNATETLLPVGSDALVLPLTMKQAEALTTIGTEWAKAQIGIPSVSLLALERRGLIEMRRVERGMYAVSLPYNSSSYQWRRKSGQNVTTLPPR